LHCRRFYGVRRFSAAGSARAGNGWGGHPEADPELATANAAQGPAILDGQPLEHPVRARLHTGSPELEREVQTDLEIAGIDL